MGRYNLTAGDHNLIVGFNYGDGSVWGGNYRNNGGRPNGVSDYVRNVSNSLEAAPDSAILNPGVPRSVYRGVRLQL